VRHPPWNDIRRFCEVDGWTATHEKTGRKRGDHDRYLKVLPDGEILRTRASHGRAEIRDPALVSRIWKHQLGVTEEQFWQAVDWGIPVGRHIETEEPPAGRRLPGWLVMNLVRKAGIPEDHVLSMTEEKALAAWNEWCAQPRH